MQLTDYVMGLTGLSFETLFMGGGTRAVVFDTHDDGSPTVKVWNEEVTKHPKPTDAELAVAMAAPDVPLVPVSVTSAQAKIQLSRTPGTEANKTLLDDVTAAVQAAGIEAQIWFSEARSWERQNPYVLALSGGLGLKTGQVDELFIEAAKIAA